jgi:hypothetical protein
MKRLLVAPFILATSHSQAETFKNMVSFGTQGLGWSGTIEQMRAKPGSEYRRVDQFLHNLGFNYSRRIGQRLQLGGFYQNLHQEYAFYVNGVASRSDLAINIFGAFVLYNFSDALVEAMYVGIAASIFNSEEENSHHFGDAEGKAPFELDDQGQAVELVFGKRFSLKRWEIEHLTFSPQVGIFYRTHGKDFNDQRIGEGVGLSLQLVKVDFLF